MKLSLLVFSVFALAAGTALAADQTQGESAQCVQSRHSDVVSRHSARRQARVELPQAKRGQGLAGLQGRHGTGAG